METRLVLGVGQMSSGSRSSFLSSFKMCFVAESGVGKGLGKAVTGSQVTCYFRYR